MRNSPILEFEYFEQIIKLRSLERESAIKKAQIGAAAVSKFRIVEIDEQKFLTHHHSKRGLLL